MFAKVWPLSVIAQRSPVWRLGLVYASFVMCPLRSIVLKCASTSPRLSPAGKPASPRNIPQAFALFAWGATIWLMLIGLFFGMRYRIDSDGDVPGSINNLMDSAANAADDIKQNLNDDK